jgi:hypothetical protein
MWRVPCTDLPKPSETVELRIPYQEGLELQKALFQILEEKVVIALIGGATLSNSYLLLIHSLLPVPESEYISSGMGTSWSARFNAQAIEEAALNRLGLLVLHSHGRTAKPLLSPIDQSSGTRFCAAFRTALPKHPHGMAVFGEDGSIGGLVWKPGSSKPITIDAVRWISDPVKRIPAPQSSYKSMDKYSSQKLLIGDAGQKLLKTSKVGVIGLCGGGSQVVQQLALLGVGTIVAVDHDIIEERNRHRLIGAHSADVGKKMAKTEIMRRLAKEANPDVKLVPVNERFPSDESLRLLKECDVLVGCVDTLSTRKEIQNFAWRYLIPYVDIGLTIEPDKTGTRAQRVSGQVYDLIPGGPCFWCAQFLTEGRLLRESGGLGPAYVVGGHHAQVVSFNGVLASQAVTEVLHIITGFSAGRGREVPNAVQFDGIKGTLNLVVLKRRTACAICKSELGKGDPVW